MAVYYSILNDVIGPIMTGPSSSHTAGPTRIGQATRMLLGCEVKSCVITFDDKGSYPATYVGQGSNYGFAGGLLGCTTETPELKDSLKEMEKRHISIEFKTADIGRTHPNAAELFVTGVDGSSVTTLTHSTGGGMFEIVRVDGFAVSINGSSKKTLVFCKEGEACRAALQALDRTAYHVEEHTGNGVLFEITHVEELPAGTLEKLRATEGVQYIRTCDVILPVALRFDSVPDFSNAKEALACGAGKAMWELALDYETKVGKITREEVMRQMLRIIQIMRHAAQAALHGESKKRGFLAPTAAKMQENMAGKKTVDVGVLNKAMLWATGVMEYNGTPGTVVAAPTAGSSGVLPGSVVAVGEEMGLSDEEIAKGLLAAGLVGVFIANHATFGAEVAACQAENGSASAMAAAGLVELLGGTTEEGFQAAAIALSNLLGLVCDPIGGFAEIPCVNRNTAAAANAALSANMAVLGYDLMIPLDDVIWSMYDVGKMLPSELRCTGCGGLCTTPAGKKLAENIGK